MAVLIICFYLIIIAGKIQQNISYQKKRKDTSIFLVSLLLCSFRVFSSSGDIKNGVMVTKFFLCSKKSDNRVYISYGFCHLLLCSTLMVMASLSSFWVWCRQVIVRLMTKVSRWSTIIFPTIFTSTGVWSENKYLYCIWFNYPIGIYIVNCKKQLPNSL